MSLQFEWDTAKARRNVLKHGVSFEEAMLAFQAVLSFSIPDPLHSIGEQRMVLLGQSNRARLLVVVHTEVGDRLRIISARLATKRERNHYEED